MTERRDVRTCRFCGKLAYATEMVSYATRHYAHGRCLIERKGVEIFQMLHRWQVATLPAMALRDAGLLEQARGVLEGKRERGPDQRNEGDDRG